MPFGYSRKIFKYPAVQYIPLNRYNEIIKNTDRARGKPRIYVYNYKESASLNDKLVFLEYQNNYSIDQGELAILIVNAKVNILQYRGYEVITIGKKSSGTYQLFTTTTEYFYKDKVIFILYNGKTSERLDIAHVDENTKDL